MKTTGIRFTAVHSVGTYRSKGRPWQHDIDELVQERRNSIANALELRLSCTNPSTLYWCFENENESFDMLNNHLIIVNEIDYSIGNIHMFTWGWILFIRYSYMAVTALWCYHIRKHAVELWYIRELDLMDFMKIDRYLKTWILAIIIVEIWVTMGLGAGLHLKDV